MGKYLGEEVLLRNSQQLLKYEKNLHEFYIWIIHDHFYHRTRRTNSVRNRIL